MAHPIEIKSGIGGSITVDLDTVATIGQVAPGSWYSKYGPTFQITFKDGSVIAIPEVINNVGVYQHDYLVAALKRITG